LPAKGIFHTKKGSYLDPDKIKKIFAAYKKGSISLKEAMDKLRSFPVHDLGFAMLDTHRSLRRGFPEVVFAEGKSTEQIIKITRTLLETGENMLLTRVNPDAGKEVCRCFKKIRKKYNETARTIVFRQKNIKKIGKNPVLILTAGTSDIPVAEEAYETARIMGNEVEKGYDVGVAGIHRIIGRRELLLNASVIIAVAGMEGALPSVVAGLVNCPVIAVPTSVGYGANLGGISALLTMLNSCSGGVLVVNIDNGFGAGFAASLINRLVYKEM
jgi:NCAIR mutase (PurE)-related protein